ncbi:peptidoglycan editing factor PgeF [Paenibacillaceae bacterium WGS1546]|uniref:peptidoglycan editing factor PgeF n=1 Tax=Cohnella sp. WGS1546 TaxID=3366810 RepID=UPI00372CF58B
MEPFQLGEAADGQDALFLLRNWCEEDGVTAGFTTRRAGNAALHVGDDPDEVVRNREKVAERVGWKFDSFTCAEQVHGTNVRVVSSADAGRGRDSRGSAFQDADALVTNESGVLLAMFFADCVPLYFYDPVSGSMGLAHAGWKGTVSGIAEIAIEKMRAAFGIDPANLRAAIGPSIGVCCYEVDETVLRHVRSLGEKLALPEAEGFVSPANKEGRARLDLKHLNRQLMIKAGIMPSRIELSSWCTSCRTDLMFSHRKEKGNTGRMMSWLGKKSR